MHLLKSTLLEFLVHLEMVW